MSLDDRLNRLKNVPPYQSHYTRVDRMREDANRSVRFLAQLLMALEWIWGKIVLPSLRWLRGPTGWVWKQYRKLWSLMVYRRDRFGALVFSKTRAGLMVLGTWFFIFYIFWPLVGFTWDGGLYALTVEHQEVVYLNSSSDLDKVTNTQSASGCLHLVDGGCTDDDTIYFRGEWSLFNQVWDWTHLRGWWFFPEYVMAPIGNQMQRCVITSYGLRRRILRWFDIYPEVLRVYSCAPLAGRKD